MDSQEFSEDQSSNVTIGMRLLDYFAPGASRIPDSMLSSLDHVTTTMDTTQDLLSAISRLVQPLTDLSALAGTEGLLPALRFLSELYLVLHTDSTSDKVAASVLFVTGEARNVLSSLCELVRVHTDDTGNEICLESGETLIVTQFLKHFIQSLLPFNGSMLPTDDAFYRSCNVRFLFYKNFAKFITGAFAMLAAVVDGMYTYVTGLPLNILPHEKRYVEWYNACLREAEVYANISGPVTNAQCRHMSQILSHMKQLHDEVSRDKSAVRMVGLLSKIENIQRPMQDIVSYHEMRTAHGMKRRTPVSLCLFGKPNQGKTLCINYLANVLWRSLYSDLSYASAVFTPDSSLEFVNGYKQQPIWLADEYFTTCEPNALAKETRDFLSYINNAPHALNMASLDDKGHTMFVSEFFLFTTNRTNWSANQGFGLTNVEALHRRIHICCEVERIKDDGNPTVCHPQQWRFKVMEFVDGQIAFTRKVVDIIGLLDLLVSKYRSNSQELGKTEEVDADLVQYVGTSINDQFIPGPSRRVNYDMPVDVTCDGGLNGFHAVPVDSVMHVEYGGIAPAIPHLFDEISVRSSLQASICKTVSFARQYTNVAKWVAVGSSIAAFAWLLFKNMGKTDVTNQQSGTARLVKIPRPSIVVQQSGCGEVCDTDNIADNCIRLVTSTPAVTVSGLFVTDDLLLTVKHWYDRVSSFSPEVHLHTGTGVFSFVWKDLRIVSIGSLDAVLVKIPRRVDGVKSLVKRFIDTDTPPVGFPSAITYRHRGNRLHVMVSGVLNIDADKEQTLNYYARVDSRDGDCGMPYVTQYNGKVIVGIHTGSLNSDNSVASILIVNRSMIEAGIAQLSSEKKQLEEVYTTYVQSKFVSTGIDDVIEDAIYPITERRRPAMMVPTAGVDPYEYGVKTISEDTVYDMSDLYDVMVEVAEEYAAVIANDQIEDPVGTMQEVICGTEGVEPLNMSASAGYPYRNQGLRRTDLIRDGKLIGDALVQYEELLRTKQAHPPLYLDFLKDELQNPKKAVEGRTRVISCPPLPYLVFHRQLFSKFVASFIRHNMHWVVKLGINPHSKAEWGTLYQDIIVGRRVIAGDFSGFDRTIPKGAQEVIILCYYKYIQHNLKDSLSIDGVRITKDDIRHIINDFMIAEHASLRKRYQATHGNPSGCVLTTVLNSLVVYTLIRAHFGDVRAAVFGDDHIIGLTESSKKGVDALTFREYLKQYGLVYTAANKEEELQPFTNNPTFLKRSFVVESVGFGCLAPLNIFSLIDELRWAKVDSTHNIIDNIKMRLLSLNMELPHLCTANREYMVSLIEYLARKYGITHSVGILPIPKELVVTPQLLQGGVKLQAGEVVVEDNIVHPPEVDATHPLMEVTSNAPVNESAIQSTGPDPGLPYPEQDFNTQLTREYLVGTFKWTTSQTFGQLIYTLSFPLALYSVPRVKQLLSKWAYLRAGVEIVMRPAANWVQYGALNMSILTTSPTTTLDGFIARNDTVYKSVMNSHVTMSAHDSMVAKLKIPWTSPFNFMPIKPNNGFWSEHICRMNVFVLSPLQLGMSDTNSIEMTVNVYARFIEPVVQGPTYSIYTQQAAESAAGAPSPSDETVQIARTSVPQAVSNIIEGVSTVSGAINRVIPNPVTMAVSKVSGYAGSVWNTIRSIGGFSKPNNPKMTGRVVQNFFPASATVEGVDVLESLGASADSAVTTDPSVFGGAAMVDDLLQIAGKESLFDYFSLTSASTDNIPGKLLWSKEVYPAPAHAEAPGSYSDVVTIAGVRYLCGATQAAVMLPSWLSFASSFYKWWRGSIRYHFHFYASSWHNTRWRVVWSPDPLPNSDEFLSYGDVLSTQVEISRGEQDLVFEVPYCHQNRFLHVAPSDHSLPYANGYIGVYVLNEVTSNNPSASVWANIYISAGKDYELGWFAPDDYRDVINKQMLVNGYPTGNEVVSDHPTSVLGLLHRYQTYQLAYEVGKYVKIPCTPLMINNTFEKVNQLNNFSWQQRLMGTFQFWHGSMRVRLWESDPTKYSHLVVGLLGGDSPPSMQPPFANTLWGHGANMTSTSYFPSVGVQVPQYIDTTYGFMFSDVNYTKAHPVVYVEGEKSGYLCCALAVGDDFSLAQPIAPLPIMVFTKATFVRDGAYEPLLGVPMRVISGDINVSNPGSDLRVNIEGGWLDGVRQVNTVNSSTITGLVDVDVKSATTLNTVVTNTPLAITANQPLSTTVANTVNVEIVGSSAVIGAVEAHVMGMAEDTGQWRPIRALVDEQHRTAIIGSAQHTSDASYYMVHHRDNYVVPHSLEYTHRFSTADNMTMNLPVPGYFDGVNQINAAYGYPGSVTLKQSNVFDVPFIAVTPV